MKFTVSSLPKDTPVQLQLFSERASKIPAQLRVVASTSWSQATLDWNTRPPLGAQAASIAGTPLNNWVTFDVTTLITRPGTYSFAIDSPAGGASNNLFSATENSNGNGPRMVIATTNTTADRQGETVLRHLLPVVEHLPLEQQAERRTIRTGEAEPATGHRRCERLQRQDELRWAISSPMSATSWHISRMVRT